MRARLVPRLTSSRTSSVQVAITRSTRRATSRSRSIRSGGLVSALPCSRCFTAPRAWKVCSTGRPTGSAAASDRGQAAHPEVGVQHARRVLVERRGQRRRSSSATCGSSASLASGAAGPASRWTTSTPGPSPTRVGQVRVVAAGVDDDVVPARRQRRRQLRRRGRSARRRRPRRPRPADWRARTPSRSSPRHLRRAIASQSARNRRQPVPLERAARAALPASRAASGSATYGPDGGGQPVHVGAQHTGRARHRLDRLGGGDRHYRHPQVHGFDQRQPQRRPPDRVHVDPPPGEHGRASSSWSAGSWRAQSLGRAGSRSACHAEHVESAPASAKRGQQVGADHPAAADRLVDHDGGARRARRCSAPRGRRRRAR